MTSLIEWCLSRTAQADTDGEQDDDNFDRGGCFHLPTVVDQFRNPQALKILEYATPSGY